jgi:transcription-repair coupling factor (superfamily II helicase)
METLLRYIEKTPYFKNILENYEKHQEIKINNTNDPVSVLVVYFLYKKTNKDIVLVTPNLFKAQKLFDTFSEFAEDEEISFFPQDEFITTEMLAMSTEFKLERINTVKKIIDKKRAIIITNTSGYIKQLIPLDKWKHAILNYKEEDVIDIKLLPSVLISYGYKRENTVEKPGEFSIRGSIIDIFPLNEDTPYRIDLFDDEIDTIRSFDVATQRSNIRVKECTIYPMYEYFYTNEELNLLKHKIDSIKQNNDFDKDSLNRIDNDIENLENRNEIDQLSRYLTLQYDRPNSLVDYIEGHTTIFYDYNKIIDNYNDIIRDITDWYEGTKDYPKMGFKLVKDLTHIYSGKSLYLDNFTNNNIKADIEINVRAKETTLYNNNIHMVINDFKKYHNFTTVIIAFKSLKKAKQFTELLDEKVPYSFIGNTDNIVEKRINIIVDEKVVSVELFDINTIILTEDNIFKQSEHKKAKYRASIKDTKKINKVEELKKGDYIVHYDYGIGRFLEVKTMTVGDITNDYIHIAYKGDDSLFIPIENVQLIQKYTGSEGLKPKLNKLGGAEWAKTKQRVRKKVKDIADKLIKLYAAREKAVGFQYSEDTELMLDFEAEFPYQETEDQLKAIEDVKRDMESTMPMDRLLCGDVGYGKTEVALRAAFKAVLDNKQVAYLAPTTVLSRQHFHTFRERLSKHGIKVELLNRFVTKSNQNRVLRELQTGECDIVIGTHRILSKDMHFKDLGMLIIDEEQRFGVEHKERIKEMKLNVDVLSLSATPIPRTLQMAIMGVKSMSLLETPPLNRYPIQTYVLERHDSVIRDSIQREIARDGQIFYLYNKVEDIEVITRKIQRLVPEARVIYAHGKMNRIDLENVITRFIDKEYDVLVSTTIIETGIDIPNANTLLVHDADRLGLSQLYQLRGRVGRSDRIAYAYLMYDKKKELKDEAIKRLRVIKEFTELGSGFKIALRDLSIRGAGDILGTEQSGFMDSVGIDLYLEMLKDEIAVQRGEKEETIDTTEEKEKPIRVRVNKYIDSNYVDNDYVKMEMHRKIVSITSKEDIFALIEEFTERFGKPSKDIELYMYEKLFEYLATIKGVERIRNTKNNVTFILSKEASKNINGEYLFLKANEISKFIRFTYRLEQINIIVDTIKLPKHYLYYIVDLLEVI